jgi:ribosomal protein L10
MRPALLVVIMDFLISSLLLFINDENPAAGSGSVMPGQIAAEYSAEAVSDMESTWMREYQDQFRDKKIADQEAMLAQLAGQTRELTEERNSLVSRISDRETVISRQKSEAENMTKEIRVLTERQVQTAERLSKVENEAEILSREKADLAAAKDRLEGMAASLAAAKARGDRLLKEAEEAQKNMVTQNEELRAGLVAQAETIRTQNETVVSQQEVIRNALTEVASAQLRIDTRTESLVKGQNQILATLTNMQAFIERLPAELSAGASVLVREQERLSNVITGLMAVARTLEDFSPEDQKAILQKLQALEGSSKMVTDQLASLSESNNLGQISGDLFLLRQQQQLIQGDVGKLVASMQIADARQAGPVSACDMARISVVTELLAEQGIGVKALEKYLSYHTSSAFVPLVRAGDKQFIAIHIEDMGLDWWGISRYLTNVVVKVGPAGSTQDVARAAGPLGLLAVDSRVAIIDCSADTGISPVLARHPSTKPMNLVGREGIEKRGYKDVYLYKKATGGVGLAVEVSPDLTDPRYLVIRKTLRPSIDQVVRFLFVNPENKPEQGDFLVTAEGAVIGVLVDSARCLVLSEDYLQEAPLQIPLNNPRTFAGAVRARKNAK